MTVPVSRNHPHEVGDPAQDQPRPQAESFADEFDRLNREELTRALEECVFLVSRVEALSVGTSLPNGDRRRLRRFCRRLGNAVATLDDRFFDLRAFGE